MGLVASLFSAVKAEVEWLITSLAVASGNGDASLSVNPQTADDVHASHRDDSTPDTQSAVLRVADQHADNTPPANSDNAQIPLSDVQIENGATHGPANLLVTADFLIDTSGPAPSPGLTPVSFFASGSDLSTIGTIVGADLGLGEQNFHVSLPPADAHIGMANSNAHEFGLASLAPQLRGDFAHGPGGGGGPAGGAKVPSYIANDGTGLEIVINFDSSVANAPKDTSGNNLFVADVDKVANFFASNFTTATGTATQPTIITINVGYGEIEGSKLGAGVLGESDTYYTTVPGANASQQYNALQGAFSTVAGIEGSHSSQQVNIAGSDPLGSASQQWWVTTAEAKALGVISSNTSVDGYIGLAAGSTFFYGSTPAGKEYDFTGTVAHEISEVMGRVTLNGAKYPGYPLPEYMPLDLFHFSSNGVPNYAGTKPGYFSVDGGATDLENFNTNSGGDLSDWATGSAPTLPVQTFPVNSFDWSGGAGSLAPVTYADYLAMEASGWAGIDSASTWDSLYPYGFA